MGFYLLEHRNPHGDHFYTSRREPMLAVVVHVTAGAEDLDTLHDLSAENVAHYAATTDRDVSWHTGSDADSWVDLLPSEYTAWHATDYNSCTHGHEISKRTTDWRNMPAVWVDKTLSIAAGGLRVIALRHNIPLRWATKAELDEQRANYRAGRPWKPVGFITHAELQWSDRRDPGYVTEGGRTFDTFPRDRFMGLLQEEDVVTQQDKNDIINGIFARLVPQLQFAGGTNGATFQSALGLLDYRTQSTNAAVALVAKSVDAVGTAVARLAEQDDRIQLTDEQLAILQGSLVAEIDELEAVHRAELDELGTTLVGLIREVARELAGQPEEVVRRGLSRLLGLDTGATDSETAAT